MTCVILFIDLLGHGSKQLVGQLQSAVQSTEWWSKPFAAPSSSWSSRVVCP